MTFEEWAQVFDNQKFWCSKMFGYRNYGIQKFGSRRGRFSISTTFKNSLEIDNKELDNVQYLGLRQWEDTVI